jgi:hypothetical protein
VITDAVSSLAIVNRPFRSLWLGAAPCFQHGRRAAKSGRLLPEAQ